MQDLKISLITFIVLTTKSGTFHTNFQVQCCREQFHFCLEQFLVSLMSFLSSEINQEVAHFKDSDCVVTCRSICGGMKQELPRRQRS